MTQKLEQKTLSIIRQLEDELLQQKDCYQKLLKDFNYNLSLLHDRDVELESQDKKLNDYEALSKKYYDYERIRDEYGTIQQRFEYLGRDHQTLKSELSKCRQQVTDNQIKYDSMYEKYHDLQDQLKNKDRELDSVTTKYEQLRQQYSQESKQNDYNNQQFNEISRILNEKDQKIAEITKQCEFQQVQLHNQQETTEYLKRLQNDNKILSEKVLELQHVNTTLTFDNEQLRTELVNIIQKYKADTKTLKQKLKDQDKTRQDSLQDDHRQITSLQLEVTKLQNLCTTYETTVKQKVDQIDNKENMIQRLQEQIAKIDKTYVEQISSAKANLSLKCQEQEELLLQQREENRKISSHLYEKEQLLKQYINQQSSFQSQIASYRDEQNVAKYKITIQNMTSDYQSVIEKVKIKDQEIELLKQQIAQLKREIQSLALENKQLIPSSQLLSLQSENQSLNLKMQTLQNEIKALQMQLLVAKADPAAPSQIVLPEHSALIQQLREKLRSAGSALRDCLSENERYVAEMQILKQENSFLKTQVLQQSQQNISGSVPPKPAKWVQKLAQRGSSDDYLAMNSTDGVARVANPLEIKDADVDLGSPIVQISREKAANQQQSLASSLRSEVQKMSPDEFPSKLSFDEHELRGEIDSILKGHGFK